MLNPDLRCVTITLNTLGSIDNSDRVTHYFIKNDAGMKAHEMNPERLDPQLMPRRVNIALAKRGKAAPKEERKRSFSIRTEPISV
jgi:hypothetical protein